MTRYTNPDGHVIHCDRCQRVPAEALIDYTDLNDRTAADYVCAACLDRYFDIADTPTGDPIYLEREECGVEIAGFDSGGPWTGRKQEEIEQWQLMISTRRSRRSRSLAC